MEIQSLKYEIIEWITNTNDSALLEMLINLKDSNIITNENWFNELNEEEVASIKRGVENHRKGEVLKSKEFWTGNEE
jgi:hypothetical protein